MEDLKANLEVPEDLKSVTSPTILPTPLEKLKRRATTIRSFSSSRLSESLNGSLLSESNDSISRNSNPLFTIRRSNSTRNRLSMPLEKLLQITKSDISVPGNPEDDSKSLLKPITSIEEEKKESEVPEFSEISDNNVIISRLYLRLDNKIKKISYEGPLTIHNLQLLFVEKFQYHPGALEFPSLYIKDPIIDVYYELEDINEVREGAVLQLNLSVSTLDLKNEMDSQFSSLVMEVRDLRRLMSQSNEVSKKANNRLSMNVPNNSRFSDLVKLAVAKNKEENASGPASHNSNIDIKSVQNEVATLRQDVSVIRQISNEFIKDTQVILAEIGQQTQAYCKLLTSEPEAVHKLLISGQARMEENAEILADSLEEIELNIQEFRNDLILRRSRPSELKIKHTSALLDKVNTLLLGESEFISEVKPAWKQAWEAKLQSVLKEQKLLKEHELAIETGRADLELFIEHFDKLTQLIELQFKNRKSVKTFKVPEAEEGFSRDAVLQEIQMVETDSERRLRAFEEARKAREWELSKQVNPFEEELSDFVGSARLRKTGGTIELDKKREEQDKENLKSMMAPRPRPPRKERKPLPTE